MKNEPINTNGQDIPYWIKQQFIEFFEKGGGKGLPKHKHMSSSSVVPANDKSLLFTNSGMVQFKDIFLGVKNPPEDSLNVITMQRCIRAGGKHDDLKEIGKSGRHHTFFEMLGHFSFGGYFKKEAITMAWVFLTEILKIPEDKLVITVYHEDEESAKIWQELTKFKVGSFSFGGNPDSFFSKEQMSQENIKIVKVKSEDNFWSMGDTGPCGPCSEIFFQTQDSFYMDENGSSDGLVEIWNLVFMDRKKLISGETEPLKTKCIDTGIGFERLVSVVEMVQQNLIIDESVDILNGIVESIEKRRDISAKIKKLNSLISQKGREINRNITEMNEKLKSAIDSIGGNKSINAKVDELKPIIKFIEGKKNLDGVLDNYQNSIFKNIVSGIEELLLANYSKQDEKAKNYAKVSSRIITDHLRSITMMIGDGVRPSAKDQGYVLRLMIRSVAKALHYDSENQKFDIYEKNKGVWMDKNSNLFKHFKSYVEKSFVENKKHHLLTIFRVFIFQADMLNLYYNTKQSNVDRVLEEEEKQFLNAVDRGYGKLSEIIENPSFYIPKTQNNNYEDDTAFNPKNISTEKDEKAFLEQYEPNKNIEISEGVSRILNHLSHIAVYMYDTHGFPYEITADEIKSRMDEILDEENFLKRFKYLKNEDLKTQEKPLILLRFIEELKKDISEKMEFEFEKTFNKIKTKHKVVNAKSRLNAFDSLDEYCEKNEVKIKEIAKNQKMLETNTPQRLPYIAFPKILFVLAELKNGDVVEDFSKHKDNIESFFIAVDRVNMYPEGGGQQGDEGILDSAEHIDDIKKDDIYKNNLIAFAKHIRRKPQPIFSMGGSIPDSVLEEIFTEHYMEGFKKAKNPESYPKETLRKAYEDLLSKKLKVEENPEDSGFFILTPKPRLEYPIAEYKNKYDEENAYKYSIINTIKHKSGVVFYYVVPSVGNQEDSLLKIGKKLKVSVNIPLRYARSIHHSATHLLNYGLRKVLGRTVVQKGSQVYKNKLRFDFSFNNDISEENIKLIQREMFSKILENAEVSTEFMHIEKATKEKQAIATFNEKYDENVRVVTIGEEGFNSNSVELCGGTHIDRTGDISSINILSCFSIGSGIKRIEAVAGVSAEKYQQNLQELKDSVAKSLSVSTKDATAEEFLNEIEHIKDKNKNFVKNIRHYTFELVKDQIKTSKTFDYQNLKICFLNLPSISDSLYRIANDIRSISENKILLLLSKVTDEDKYTAMIIKPNFFKNKTEKPKLDDIQESYVNFVDTFLVKAGVNLHQGMLKTNLINVVISEEIYKNITKLIEMYSPL